MSEEGLWKLLEHLFASSNKWRKRTQKKKIDRIE